MNKIDALIDNLLREGISSKVRYLATIPGELEVHKKVDYHNSTNFDLETAADIAHGYENAVLVPDPSGNWLVAILPDGILNQE